MLSVHTFLFHSYDFANLCGNFTFLLLLVLLRLVIITTDLFRFFFLQYNLFWSRNLFLGLLLHWIFYTGRSSWLRVSLNHFLSYLLSGGDTAFGKFIVCWNFDQIRIDFLILVSHLSVNTAQIYASIDKALRIEWLVWLRTPVYSGKRSVNIPSLFFRLRRAFNLVTDASI